MVTLYNAASADGFIARKDGSEDFIPDNAWEEYLQILESYDVAVMGKKTYETLQGYPKEMLQLFEALPITRLVLSRDTSFQPKAGYAVTTELSDIRNAGKNVLITSGPALNTAALEAGIINRMMLNIVPVMIGDGIPVFYHQPELELVSTDRAPSGREVCTYKIRNQADITHPSN